MNIREESITIVASQAHEDWKKEHFADPKRPGYPDAPRWKDTVDAAWIAWHNATKVDLAHTKYVDLPSDWQAENLAGATIAVDAVLATDVHDDAFIERTSDVLHAAWIDRNRSWAPPEQLLPYAELTEGEKNKDRVFVVNAIDTVKRVRLMAESRDRSETRRELGKDPTVPPSDEEYAEALRRAEEFRKDNGAF